MVRFTDRFLKSKTKDYRKTLKIASLGIARIRNLNKLLNVIVRLARKSAGLTYVGLYILDEAEDKFILKAQRGKSVSSYPESLSKDEPLVSWLSKEKNPLRYEELERYIKQVKRTDREKNYYKYLLSIKRTQDRMSADLCIPGFIEDRLYCILTLGKKLNRKKFTQDDIEAFITLTNQAAIAIENAKAYEELKNTKDQLVSTENLITAGRLAASLAHEIKNPLTAIKTFAQMIPEKYNDPSFREKLAKIIPQEVDRIDSIIRQLLDFAQPKQPKLGTAKIHDIIDSTLELLEKELQTKDIEVKKDYQDPELEITLDKDQVKQVFLNLFLNSLEAMERNGKLRLATYKKAGYLVINIVDTGKGIPKEHLEHLFDPFVTTKERGTGLGLNIVKRIIESHKGSIEVESQPEVGTAVTIRLPLV